MFGVDQLGGDDTKLGTEPMVKIAQSEVASGSLAPSPRKL